MPHPFGYQRNLCLSELRMFYLIKKKLMKMKRGSISVECDECDFIFSYEPIPFNGQNYQTQKGPGTSDQLLFRLQTSSEKFLY